MRFTILAVLFFASPVVAADLAYSWKTLPGDVDRIYLYENGRQVGGWCYRTQKYRTFDGTTWGEPTDRAPTKPPANRVVITPAAPPAMIAPPPPATASRTASRTASQTGRQHLRGRHRRRNDAHVRGVARRDRQFDARFDLPAIFKRK